MDLIRPLGIIPGTESFGHQKRTGYIFSGWCLEILFTSVEAWMRGDVKMMGTTSVIMFPIYAAGAILPDIVKWCDRWLSGLPDFLKADREEISPVA